MGDVNVRHERWGGDGVVENVEGRRFSVRRTDSP